MNSISVKQEYDDIVLMAKEGNERISSSTNQMLNKKLFRMIRMAASTLQEAEKKEEKIKQKEIELNQEINKSVISSVIIVLFMILAGIVCFCVYLSTHFDDATVLQVVNYMLENGYEDVQELAQQALRYGDILGGVHMYLDNGLYKYYLYIVFPIRALIGSFPGWIVVSAAFSAPYVMWVTNRKKRHLAKVVPEKEKEINDAKQELQNFIQNNEQILQFIPRACSSSKNTFMVVELYERGKADNLKEALNLADTHMFRDNIYSALISIINSSINIEDNVYY